MVRSAVTSVVFSILQSPVTHRQNAETATSFDSCYVDCGVVQSKTPIKFSRIFAKKERYVRRTRPVGRRDFAAFCRGRNDEEAHAGLHDQWRVRFCPVPNRRLQLVVRMHEYKRRHRGHGLFRFQLHYRELNSHPNEQRSGARAPTRGRLPHRPVAAGLGERGRGPRLGRGSRPFAIFLRVGASERR